MGLHLTSGRFVSPVSGNKLMIIFFALVAEEFGWRGFLQNLLDEKIQPVFVPAIIGVIWAMWHYHFVLAGTMEIPVIAFMISCILESYGYYWIVKKANGNVIGACIWHFSGNLFSNLFQTDVYWICNLVYIIYFAIFILAENKKQKQMSTG